MGPSTLEHSEQNNPVRHYEQHEEYCFCVLHVLVLLKKTLWGHPFLPVCQSFTYETSNLQD
jgi:hypothetical protein